MHWQYVAEFENNKTAGSYQILDGLIVIMTQQKFEK